MSENHHEALTGGGIIGGTMSRMAPTIAWIMPFPSMRPCIASPNTLDLLSLSTARRRGYHLALRNGTHKLWGADTHPYAYLATPSRRRALCFLGQVEHHLREIKTKELSADTFELATTEERRKP